MKLEFDNNKFNKNLANIQLDDFFTTGLKEFKKFNKKDNFSCRWISYKEQKDNSTMYHSYVY